MELFSVVMSCAGRDQGKYFAVISNISDNYVGLADGQTRRLENPKKKKVKHVKLISGSKAEQFDPALYDRPTNVKLKKYIHFVLNNNQ